MDRVRASRARAIEGFAGLLAQLRDAVGTPSFRVMAGRSGAISHTTLHEAVQGNRLPSWETTAEFVKACGADPDDYRRRWEGAHRTACRASPAGRTPDPLPPEASHGSADTEGLTDPADTPNTLNTPNTPGPPGPTGGPSGPPPRWRGGRAYAGAAALAAMMVAGGGAIAWSLNDPDVVGAQASPQPSAVDCPVKQENPAPAPPAHAGDEASFISDMSLPDCTHVGRGVTSTKIWRLKNTGTVPWVRYRLHRVDMPQEPDQCETIPDVPIPSTDPGSMVDVRVQVMAPRSSGFCFVRFKMVDAAGDVAFPGSRPVNFQVIID